MSPPDEESFRTAIRTLTDMSISTVKSSKSPILQVQSICAIFGLNYNTFYVETEVSSLNSSQSESEFCKSTLSGGDFKRRELFFELDNSGEFKFVAKKLLYQDKDPPKILLPPDEKSCGTVTRSLTCMSIYTVKSSKTPILQVQSACDIFGLDYNTFYIETEISSLNSSQSEFGF